MIISYTAGRRTLPPVLVADKEIGSLGTVVMNGCIDFPDTGGEAQVLNGPGEPCLYAVATDSPVLVIYRKTEEVVRILEESDLLFVRVFCVGNANKQRRYPSENIAHLGCREV